MGLSEVNRAIENGSSDTARRILMHKEDHWAYECEYRVLTKRKFVGVEVKEIIFGERISRDEEDLIKKLVGGLRKKIKFYKGINKEIVS